MDRGAGRTLPKRAAVTGGAGFIGSHVVRQLLAAGVEVSVLMLPGDRGELLDTLDVRRVTGNIASGEGLDELMDGADGVFHLAAIYALWLPQPERMFEVNVGGTRNVMAAARAAGVERVVHTSSIAAIGYLEGRQQSDETIGFDDWCGEPYVVSKYVSELEALAAVRDGLDVVVVNPGFPIGQSDIAPTPTGRVVWDLSRGRLPVLVEGGLSVVDVRDVAQGHLLAWQHGRTAERYLLAGHNITLAELAEAIAQEADCKAPRMRVSARTLGAAGWLLEQVSEHITRRPPMMTRASVRYTAERYLWFSTAKAREELGYLPRPLHEAVASAVAWFRGR